MPLIAAMVVRSRSSIALKVVCTPSMKLMKSTGPAILDIAAISAPAQNARPLPVKITIRTAASARTAATSLRKSAIISGLIALSLFGRLSRTVAIPSAHSYCSVSYITSLPPDCFSVVSARPPPRAPLDHCQAAADRQRLAGYVGSVVGGEEGDRGGDVGGLGDPPQRHRTLERLVQLGIERGQLLELRRVGRARAYAVDRDVVARHLARERLAERDHAALGARVHRLAGRAHAPGIRADRYDPAAPACDHRVEHRATAVERPAVIDRDYLVPGLLAVLDERFGLVPSGVVDQDVDRPKAALRLGDRRAHAGELGDVDRDGDRAPADLGRRGGGAARVEVGQRDLASFLRQALGDRPADPARGAGDERDLAAESAHDVSPYRRKRRALARAARL